MRTIAIINQKGGCGKTTTSINLAAVLALRGHRTLLVDMDPQSHCALGLAVPENQIQQSVADLLEHGLDGSVAVGDITWQISRGLDLAPSSMSLAMMEQQLALASDKDRRLAQVLSPAADLYDFCIIDCPPSIGLLTFNALRAADEVLIPVETGYFAMQGSVRQEQTIEMLVRRVGQRVRFRVLPTMYDVRTKLAREILAELKKHFGQRVLPMVINFNSKLKEAASFGQPISEYDAASRGMQDFEELAQWLVDHPPFASHPPHAHIPATAAAAAGPHEAAVEDHEYAPASRPEETVHATGAADNASGPSPAAAPAPAVTDRLGHLAPPAGRPDYAAAAESRLAPADKPAPPAPTSTPTPADAPARAAAPANPALSRAAELVERARALSARSADLNQRFRHTPATPAPGHAPAAAGPPLPQSSSDAPDRSAAEAAGPQAVPPLRQPRPAAANLAVPPTAADTPRHPLATGGPPAAAAADADRPRPVTTNGAATLRPLPPSTPPTPDADADPDAAESRRQQLAKLYGVRLTSRGVLFVQPATTPDQDDPQALAIAGDFNNWNPAQTPMTRDENLGVWRACVQIPAGRFRYRLVRNGQWIQDPFNTHVETNPFGELNNIIQVQPVTPETPPARPAVVTVPQTRNHPAGV